MAVAVAVTEASAGSGPRQLGGKACTTTCAAFRGSALGGQQVRDGGVMRTGNEGRRVLRVGDASSKQSADQEPWMWTRASQPVVPC